MGDDEVKEVVEWRMDMLDRRLEAIGTLLTAIAAVGLGVLAGVWGKIGWGMSEGWASGIGTVVAITAWVKVGVWIDNAWLPPTKNE